MIDGPCPLFAIDANTRGSGKSLLADVAGKIAFGYVMPRKALPRQDEEMRKAITSMVLQGSSAVLFDNVTGTLGCSSLDMALTSRFWEDRILGESRMIRANINTIWIATGNNLSFGDDTARRSVYCRLESEMANPEDRAEFRYPDILEHCSEKRAQLVVAALTAVRAYLVAGRPAVEVRPLGSFEAWSQLVANVIVWSGYPSPLSTQAVIRDNDRSFELLERLVAGLEQLPGIERGLTAGDIAELVNSSEAADYTVLRNVLDEKLDGQLSGGRMHFRPGKICYLLREYKGRVCNGRKLSTGRRTSSGYVWHVEHASGEALKHPTPAVSFTDGSVTFDGASSPHWGEV